MPTPLCFWIIHREGNHNWDEMSGLFQRALKTQVGDGLVAELWTLLWAPHVASSGHGVLGTPPANSRSHFQKPLSFLGRSLLAAPHSSCWQAHSNHSGGSNWNISGSHLLPYHRSNSQPPHLPHIPCLFLSASTSNELLIAAHPIKGLLHVNNSWLLVRAVGWQARQH